MWDAPLKPLLIVGAIAALAGGALGTGATVLLTDSGVLEVSGKEGKKGPPGDKGPRGAPGPQGPQGDVGDAQSQIDDLDSRVSDLENIDVESGLSDLDSRVSDLETFQSGLCDELLISGASILNDLNTAAC